MWKGEAGAAPEREEELELERSIRQAKKREAVDHHIESGGARQRHEQNGEGETAAAHVEHGRARQCRR